MPEPVFRTLEIVLKGAITATGTKITIHGQYHIPERGGALIAMNHTSYVDWLPAELAAVNRGRRLRFLIKAELQQLRTIKFVIKHITLIPVDRCAGGQAYALAVQQLREGELVGLHPEALEQTQAALRAALNTLLYQAQQRVERERRRADGDKTARKLVELSPRRWHRLAPHTVGEQPKRIT